MDKNKPTGLVDDLLDWLEANVDAEPIMAFAWYGGGLPTNFISGEQFGRDAEINLHRALDYEGYGDAPALWAEEDVVKNSGFSIKPEREGFEINGTTYFNIIDCLDENGNDLDSGAFILRHFNQLPPDSIIQPIPEAEDLLDKSGASLYLSNGPMATWGYMDDNGYLVPDWLRKHPDTRAVILFPEIEKFYSQSEFYGVVFHELFHCISWVKFQKYAFLKTHDFEEIKVEAASVMLLMQMGLIPDSFSARYILDYKTHVSEEDFNLAISQAAELLEIANQISQSGMSVLEVVRDKKD